MAARCRPEERTLLSFWPGRTRSAGKNICARTPIDSELRRELSSPACWRHNETGGARLRGGVHPSVAPGEFLACRSLKQWPQACPCLFLTASTSGVRFDADRAAMWKRRFCRNRSLDRTLASKPRRPSARQCGRMPGIVCAPFSKLIARLIRFCRSCPIRRQLNEDHDCSRRHFCPSLPSWAGRWRRSGLPLARSSRGAVTTSFRFHERIRSFRMKKQLKVCGICACADSTRRARSPG